MKNNYFLKSLFLIVLGITSTVSFGQTFNYTGAVQTYTVPVGVTGIGVDVYGAKGGDNGANIGGQGGRTQAEITVVPGQVLEIYVGGQGVSTSTPGTGGWNGGGNTLKSFGSGISGTGGGGSDIRVSPYAITNRIVVAGGGGGSGYQTYAGANGGGLIGQDAVPYPTFPTSGGKGGTQVAGGAAGNGALPQYLCTPGALFQGGTGDGDGAGSGGGGGGYYGAGGGMFCGGGGGSSYTIPGATSVVHTQGVQNGNGQVIITVLCTGLNVSVTPSINVCEGDPVTITGTSTGTGTVTWDNGITNGASFPNSTAGVTTYTSSSTDAGDCTSQVTITVSAPTAITDVHVACDTYTWIDANTYTSNNNTATVTLTNAAGCDSVITLDLTINVSPNAGTNNTLTTCNNDATTDLFTLLAGADAGGAWSPVLTSGTGVFDPATDAAGTYTYTVNGIAPCANVTATVIVTVNQTTASTDVHVVCDTYTWIDANVYTTNNNTATVTLTNAAGCDSVVTLDLTINVSPNAGTNNTLTTCNNDATADLFTLLAGADAGGAWSPVLTSGTGVFDPATDAAGTYTYTVNGIAPCANATATLIITVNQTTASTDVHVACDTYTWIDANVYTTNNNTATVTLTNAAGCDSVVTLDLTINQSPFVLMNPFNQDTICETDNSINLPVVTPTGGTYSGNGVAGNMFDPSVAGVGSHYVLYTYTDGNNCAVSDSSLIEVISCVGINENSTIGQVNIYPNPANNVINVSMANGTSPVNFTLLSIDGKVVYQLNNVTDKTVAIDISNNSQGIYFLRVATFDNYKVYKVIKQ
jgi:hypothetical protein